MNKAEVTEGHQDQEQGDMEFSNAEIQEMCEAQVLAMSGRAGAGATSDPKCPAPGKGRHSREDCWVLHPHKAPEWLQDKLKSKKIGKGGQAKPAAQGGGKGKGPHKEGKFLPCKGCRSTLHPPEDCWTLHPELREKAKAGGRLGKRHNCESRRQRWKSKRIDLAGRDMGPSPATVCPIIWVNQVQAGANGYCTRPVLRISGAEEDLLRLPRPGLPEKLPKRVIVPGLYIPHKGTSERIEALSLGDTGKEVIVVAAWGLFPEQFREVATQRFRLLGVGEKELEGENFVVRGDISMPVQRGSQVLMARCADCLVYSTSGGPRAILGLPYFARYGLVVLPDPGRFAHVEDLRQGGPWDEFDYKCPPPEAPHHCTWRAAGCLCGMSMGWSMTRSCAALFKARLRCLPWMTRA